MKNGKKQYRVCVPIVRDKDQKEPFWKRIGTGWENPGREGKPPCISVCIDTLPLAQDPYKGAELVLFEDDGKPPQSKGKTGQNADDQEPF